MERKTGGEKEGSKEKLQSHKYKAKRPCKNKCFI
jgi:hypothetical protein